MTEDKRLKANGILVDSLASAIRNGGTDLGNVPGLLKKLLRDEAWREFETALGKHVTYARFEMFVQTPPLAGLGATVDLVRRIISDDPQAVDALDIATQHTAGNPTGANQYQGNVDNIHGSSRPDGTSQATALRRLRKDRPDLHQLVLDGGLSAHAAAVQAGFRKKAATVHPGDPEAVARTLRRHMTPEGIRALIALLDKEEGEAGD